MHDRLEGHDFGGTHKRKYEHDSVSIGKMHSPGT